MLTFFRINSIFQVFSLMVLIILIRMLFFPFGLPLLSLEIEWSLVGKKLNDGLFLYSEVLTQTGPLASYFYQMIDAVFGRSFFIYNSIAALLVFVQALILNFMVNRRNLLNEKNYVAGLLYVVLMSISFDFFKLSPALMANTFVLLGVKSVLSQIEKRDGVGDDVFEVGIVFGIAMLFHHPAFVFLFWAILVLLLYTAVNIRQVFMVILAFALPIIFMYFFFYFNSFEEDFVNTWLTNFNSFVMLSWLNIRDFLIVYTLPTLLSLFGIARVLRGFRYNSFQNRSHQSLIILGIFALLAFLLSGKYIPSNLVYIILPLAFYCAGFFIHSKGVFVPEIIFLVFTSTILFIAFIGANSFLGFSLNQLADYRVKESEGLQSFEGKRIFITGRNLDAYQDNDMATGYLSWNLARLDFENPNNYLSISNIYNNFSKDMPEVIIDDERVMPKVFENLPELAKKFKKEKGGVYILK